MVSIEKRREQKRKWARKNYWKNRDKYLKYYQEHREEILRKNKEYYKTKIKELKNQLGEYFGTTCQLCRGSYRLGYHEIHGKDHPRKVVKKLRYILKHKESFIYLCWYCHYAIHGLSKTDIKNINIKKFIELISLLKQNV